MHVFMAVPHTAQTCDASELLHPGHFQGIGIDWLRDLPPFKSTAADCPPLENFVLESFPVAIGHFMRELHRYEPLKPVRTQASLRRAGGSSCKGLESCANGPSAEDKMSAACYSTY